MADESIGQDVAAAIPSPLEGEGQGGGSGAEGAEQARLAYLEQQLAERDQQIGALAQELEAARAGLGDAQRQGLEHLRRALLAEHAGQVVPELIVGTTPDELHASVEAARAAYANAVEAARHQLQSQQVPVGNPARGQEDLERLPPTDKIARGLSSH